MTRKPLFGNSRSHAMNSTRRMQKTNKQKINVDGKQVTLTAKEIKTIKKNEI